MNLDQDSEFRPQTVNSDSKTVNLDQGSELRLLTVEFDFKLPNETVNLGSRSGIREKSHPRRNL